MFKTTQLPGYSQIDIALNPWKTKNYLKQLNPTHVHVSVEGPLGISARLFLKKIGWNYTSAYHTNFPDYVKNHYGLPEKAVIPAVKWFHKHSSAVLAPSETTANKLKKWGISSAIPWSRGFNSDIFNPLPRGQVKPYLLYVGRVSPEKNIEAFLELKVDGYELVVVGDGPSRAELEKKYPSATFVGFKTGAELASFYQQAAAFVFPSKTDTLGVVMIESIACGTPVAAYPVEGPQDVVTQGLNGVLDNNLERAVRLALDLDRDIVADSSRKFSWDESTDTFENSLVTIF